ncbi:glycosyltransferase family 2 protein [Laspinema palackyanum]|uniref:glycosyltransferase family 2 protein n=1 Tax=Laspinema palackyanum TaxID=3231601 RepID=UPI00345C8E5C|nr:glycosyltransferase [Laspinema sp. D2c]
MPTYNHGHYIGRAIKSLLDQTYQHWELIIINNFSTDDTVSIVRECQDQRIRLINFRNNGIIAASRNYGIQHAKGTYIAFLDSDDWWTSQKLEICVPQLEQGFDICSHDLWLVKSENQRFLRRRLRSRSVSLPVYDDLLYNGNGLLNSSVVVKAEILKQIGGQSEDPELIAAEDYDCWLRIAQETDKFIYIPKVLGYYWVGGDNISNPQRLLVFSNRLYFLYMRPYTQIHKIEPPVWWLYCLSKANFLIGNDKDCQHFLLLLLLRSTDLIVSIKVLYMLIIVLMRGTFSLVSKKI